MKAFEQLELQLWQSLQTAQAVPESADLDVLWGEMEKVIQGRELKAQLEVSAEAILQMAGVLQKRSRFFDEALAMRSGADPVMAADAFDRFVRQFMDVDFEQFIEPLERKEHDYPEVRELVSVVEMVSKEELLGLLELESQLEPMPMLELEHDEDVAAWAEALRGWMGTRKMKSVKLKRVVEATGLPVTKAWMAGLLEGFKLTRDSESEEFFYSYSGLVLRIKSVKQREVA
jgi:hypothetical protein